MRLYDRFLQLATGLLLLAAPWPFGSVTERAAFGVIAAVCLLVVLFLAGRIAAGRIETVRLPVWPATVALLLYLGCTMLPLPSGLARRLSPETQRIYDAAASATGAVDSPRLTRTTLTPFDTEGEWLKIAAYALFLLVCVNVLRRGRGHVGIYHTLIASGAALSIFGVVQNLWGNGRIFWKYASGSASPFGPFVNHNHFAGYLELTLGLALGMLVAEYRRLSDSFTSSGFASWFAAITRPVSGRFWYLLAAVFIMLTALAASLSRGGALSVAVTAVLFAAALGLRPGTDRRDRGRVWNRRRMALAGLLLVLGVMAILSLSPRGRARWRNLSDAASRYRLELWRDSLPAVAAFPWVGSGLGSFSNLYPRYQRRPFPPGVTHVENEYLQWLIETGIVGFALMGGVAWLYATQLRKILGQRRDPEARSLTLGALFSLVSFSLHNLVDFNGHIPSNALTFVAVAALALLAAACRRRPDGNQWLLRTRDWRAGGWRGLLPLAVLGVFAAGVLYLASLRVSSVELLRRWEAAGGPAARTEAGEPRLDLLQRSVRLCPWHDRSHVAAASAWLAAAADAGVFRFSEMNLRLAGARREALAALALRPAYGRYWSLLARILSMQGDLEAAERAFRQAADLAGADAGIHRAYGELLLLKGDFLGAAARFASARALNPSTRLRELLRALSARTGDRQAWEALVRETPEDLRAYAEFLDERGLLDLAAEARGRAEALEASHRRGP